jgi:hypothetical protein
MRVSPGSVGAVTVAIVHDTQISVATMSVAGNSDIAGFGMDVLLDEPRVSDRQVAIQVAIQVALA